MSETTGGERHAPEARPRPAAQTEPPKRERGGRGGGEQPDQDAWMVTMADLLVLLMTFFVLIFAAQDPLPPEKLQEAFGQTTGVFSLFRTGFLERISVAPRRDISQDLVQVFLDEIGALDVDVIQEERGLVITLPTDTFFAPGSPALNRRARTRIDQLSAFLAVTKHRIRVEGHTDTRERVQPPYPGIWELSVARAHRVMRRLERNGVAEDRLALVGYGPAKPLFDNVSARGRARNRRVEIVILNRRNPRP